MRASPSRPWQRYSPPAAEEVFGRALDTQRTAVLDELRASQQRLRHIEMMIEESKGSIMTTIEIQRTRTPAMTVVSLRGTVPVYSQEGVLWERFMPELAGQGIQPNGPGGVIEHDREYVHENPDLSVFLPVAPGTTANAPLEILQVPEQRCSPPGSSARSPGSPRRRAGCSTCI